MPPSYRPTKSPSGSSGTTAAPTTNSSGANQTVGVTPTQKPTLSPGDKSQNGESGNGKNSVDVAGIAVGCTLGVIFLCVMAGITWLHLTSKKEEEEIERLSRSLGPVTLPQDKIPDLSKNPLHSVSTKKQNQPTQPAGVGGLPDSTDTGRRQSAEVDTASIYKARIDEHPVQMTQNPMTNKVVKPTRAVKLNKESESLEEIPL